MPCHPLGLKVRFIKVTLPSPEAGCDIRGVTSGVCYIACPPHRPRGGTRTSPLPPVGRRSEARTTPPPQPSGLRCPPFQQLINGHPRSEKRVSLSSFSVPQSRWLWVKTRLASSVPRGAFCPSRQFIDRKDMEASMSLPVLCKFR